MKRVFTAHDIASVVYIRDMLIQEGIPADLRGQHLQGAVGDIPPIETWPEVWVAREDEDRSRALISAFEEADSNAKPWTCPQCSEELEAQFGSCWNCSTDRPGL